MQKNNDTEIASRVFDSLLEQLPEDDQVGKSHVISILTISLALAIEEFVPPNLHKLIAGFCLKEIRNCLEQVEEEKK